MIQYNIHFVLQSFDGMANDRADLHKTSFFHVAQAKFNKPFILSYLLKDTMKSLVSFFVGKGNIISFTYVYM